MSIFKNNRIGIFRVDIDIINNNPKELMELMGKCIVIKADIDAINNWVEYTAISDYFYEIYGCLIPPVIYRITLSGNGEYKFDS